MANTINQVKYDELQAIAKTLQSESEAFGQLHTSTRSKVDALRSGWSGDAANAFFHESEQILLPAVDRGSKALLDAQTVLNQIIKTIHDADTEVATYFTDLDHRAVDASTGLFSWLGVGSNKHNQQSPIDILRNELEQKYGKYIQKYADETGVPYKYILGVITKEQLDHGLVNSLGEFGKKLLNDPKVSLGLGQVQIRRAAEFEYPGRDFSKTPLTNEQIKDLAKKLEVPEYNIRIVSKELKDNYDYFGKNPGKTEEDRWKFALAAHKSGKGTVGNAQHAINQTGGDSNKWDNVSKHLENQITDFVDSVMKPNNNP